MRCKGLEFEMNVGQKVAACSLILGRIVDLKSLSFSRVRNRRTKKNNLEITTGIIRFGR